MVVWNGWGGLSEMSLSPQWLKDGEYPQKVKHWAQPRVKGYNQGSFYGIQVPASRTVGRWVIYQERSCWNSSVAAGWQLYKGLFYQIRVFLRVARTVGRQIPKKKIGAESKGSRWNTSLGLWEAILEYWGVFFILFCRCVAGWHKGTENNEPLKGSIYQLQGRLAGGLGSETIFICT